MDSLSMKWTLSSGAEDRREELHLDMARLADAQLFLDTVKNIGNVRIIFVYFKLILFLKKILVILKNIVILFKSKTKHIIIL